jgi:hypothetical protein
MFHLFTLERFAVARGNGWAVGGFRSRWPTRVTWPRYDA